MISKIIKRWLFNKPVYDFILFISLCSIVTFSACKKLVDIAPPVTQPDAKIIYSNNESAISVLTGLYKRMSELDGVTSGTGGISIITGLTGDELKAYVTDDPLLGEAYTNSLSSLNAPFWSKLYNYIYTTNSVIDGLGKYEGVDASVKTRLIGEAKFMRAFFHFYLVNLFGDVPIVTSIDYKENSKLIRSSTSDVYIQIINDLKDASEDLASEYSGIDLTTVSNERIRPNKWAAKALLARACLYSGQWKDAELYATEVINQSTFYQLTKLDDVFLSNSLEAIWQIQPTTPEYNTWDGYVFNIVDVPDYDHPVAIQEGLYNDFEDEDMRKIKWIKIVNGFICPYKYKIGQSSEQIENLMVLRLAEQYLIRAEARLHLNVISGANSACEDLNVIRNRAGLNNYTSTNATDVLEKIVHEKKVEFFSEWGARWFDLKRWELIDKVMAVVSQEKESMWNKNWALFPIPLESAIKRNPGLKQNDGY